MPQVINASLFAIGPDQVAGGDEKDNHEKSHVFGRTLVEGMEVTPTSGAGAAYCVESHEDAIHMQEWPDYVKDSGVPVRLDNMPRIEGRSIMRDGRRAVHLKANISY